MLAVFVTIATLATMPLHAPATFLSLHPNQRPKGCIPRHRHRHPREDIRQHVRHARLKLYSRGKLNDTPTFSRRSSRGGRGDDQWRNKVAVGPRALHALHALLLRHWQGCRCRCPCRRRGMRAFTARRRCRARPPESRASRRAAR